MIAMLKDPARGQDLAKAVSSSSAMVRSIKLGWQTFFEDYDYDQEEDDQAIEDGADSESEHEDGVIGVDFYEPAEYDPNNRLYKEEAPRYERQGGRYVLVDDHGYENLKDLSSFQYVQPLWDRIKDEKIKPDDYLSLFLRVMKYLVPIFPKDTLANHHIHHYLPFTIDAVYYPGQLQDLCTQTSQAWPSVYEEHPSWVKEGNKRDLTLVIRGTLTFFQYLARHCWPLGRLGNNNAFSNHPENLQVFTKILSYLSGDSILFLYGGSSFVSEMSDVTGTLRASCLNHSPAFVRGEFKLSFYDDYWRGTILSQHFEDDPEEQDYVAYVQEFQARGEEAYDPDHEDDEQEDLNDDDDEGGEDEMEEDDNQGKQDESNKATENLSNLKAVTSIQATTEPEQAAEEDDDDDDEEDESEYHTKDKLSTHSRNSHDDRVEQQAEEAKQPRTQSRGHLADILYEYREELSLFNTINKDSFRDLIWRLRQPSHWAQLTFLHELRDGDIHELLDKYTDAFDASTAFKDAANNIDSFNRVKRLGGWDQAPELPCGCTEELKLAHERGRQEVL